MDTQGLATLVVDELTAGISNPTDFVRIVLRLGAAMVLGAVIGLQRESVGAAAGLRTHMLVTLSATLFVLTPWAAGLSGDELSRVVQGVATGIGFIGGGAVLKLSAEREIRGLTTAASIWLATAAGIAIGMGRIGLATMGVAFSWIILAILGRLQNKLAGKTNTGSILDPGAALPSDELRPR